MGKDIPKEKMQKGNAARIKLDVANATLPVGIGIEIPGGRTYNVIPAGTKLPVKHAEMFSTSESGQLAADFTVLLGDRPLAKDNLELCHIRVRNVRYGGAGEAKLNVDFNIDRNGVFTVSTRNLDRSQKRDIAMASVATDHVTHADLDAFMAEAEANKESDQMMFDAIATMLDGYQLLSDTYEEYAYAKKSMSYGDRHQYRKARKRLKNALNVMPPETTEATIAELKAALADLQQWFEKLKEHKQRVESWYEKK